MIGPNQNLNMVLSLRVNAKGEIPMYMKLVKGKWYSNIPDPNKPGYKIQAPLDAFEKEKRKAAMNLGTVIADMERGINPTTARKKISRLEISGKITERTESALRKHIFPFFGEYRPRDINETSIEKYIEHRFGRSDDGDLQAYGDTLKKELLALQRLLQSVFGRGFRLPTVKYKNLTRKILPPLTLEQIEGVGDYVLAAYKPVYWIMAYTGMDVSDVLSLTPGDFKEGWIIKERGKSGVEIEVPVCAALGDLLKNVPWPLKQDARIFQNMTPNGAAIHVRRCFKKAGLEGYGSKYLRRFIASVLLDMGCTMDYIGQALAHAEGSKVTKKYTKVYKGRMEELFGKIKNKKPASG